jgi:4-amino-4-deoxy-L-arabinose transferase-like glycosyltransferase
VVKLSLGLNARPFSSQRRLALLLALVTLAGLTWLRTADLLRLPIYYDEALHIERAQRALTERTLLMGTEGGKYLQIWLLALILPITQDPLLAARLLSATAGLLAGIGCYLLALQLYARDDIALMAACLYATSPYLLFFDRMGMADGLLSTLAVWILLLSLIAMRAQRWWPTLALGLCLGLAAAAKLTGILFFAFPALAVWFWWSKRPSRQLLTRLLLAWLLATPWLLPSLLDFSHQLGPSLERSWLSSAEKGIPHLTRLSYNLNAIATTLWTYLTPLILALVLIEMARNLRPRAPVWVPLGRDGMGKATWLLTLAAFITLAFFLLTSGADKFYSRYILPAFPFLLILAGRRLVALADWFSDRVPRPTTALRSAALVGLALLVGLPGLRFDYLLLTDPPRVPWLPRDRALFVDGPLAGYGVIDAAAYLRQQADQLSHIIVVKRTDNQNRTGAWGYYLDRPNILLEAINLKYADSQELIQALRDAPAPVFAVLDRPSEDLYADDFTRGPYAPYADLVATFPRPGGASRIEVYRLTPQPQ